MSGQQAEILTIDEFAAYLRAYKRTVYRLAARWKLPSFAPGAWSFSRGDLDRWIANCIGKAIVDDAEVAK